MKLLIVGEKNSIESALLEKEAKKLNHQVELFSMRQLLAGGREKLTLSLVPPTNGPDLKIFDAVLFRAISRHITEAQIAANLLQKMGKAVIDEILTTEKHQHHKFLMHAKMWQKGIPQPATFQPLNLGAIRLVLNKIKPPIIVKNIRGMHGRNLYRFDSKKKVLDFFLKDKKRLGQYLLQEWLPSKKYFRTLVVGNKVLGSIERIALRCRQRPKLPLEKRSKKARLTPELEKLSLKATRACELDFAGLDIMPDRTGRLRVLEVNRSPQFKKFTKITEINVAKKVIEYIQKKVSAKNF